MTSHLTLQSYLSIHLQFGGHKEDLLSDSLLDILWYPLCSSVPLKNCYSLKWALEERVKYILRTSHVPVILFLCLTPVIGGTFTEKSQAKASHHIWKAQSHPGKPYLFLTKLYILLSFSNTSSNPKSLQLYSIYRSSYG